MAEAAVVVSLLPRTGNALLLALNSSALARGGREMQVWIRERLALGDDDGGGGGGRRRHRRVTAFVKHM